MGSNKIVSYGEVLWDLLPDGPVLGGAPFNFIYRAQCLGNTGIFISRVGSDEKGREALGKVEGLGIRTDFIEVDEKHPTGTVHVKLDKNKNPSYVIVENAAYDYIEYRAEIARAVEDFDCICFGSLIQRNETSRKTLYKLLDRFSGTHILFDINIRKDCHSLETISASLNKSTILKLNEEEIGVLAEMFDLKETTIRGRAIESIKRFNLSTCLVTLGDRGLFAVSEDGVEYYTPAFRVNLADPIGSGDACTAGFVDAILDGKSLSDAAVFAAAAGAVVAEQSGATKPITRADVEKMLGKREYSEVHPQFDV